VYGRVSGAAPACHLLDGAGDDESLTKAVLLVPCLSWCVTLFP
jgi:hypothetical protein